MNSNRQLPASCRCRCLSARHPSCSFCPSSQEKQVQRRRSVLAECLNLLLGTPTLYHWQNCRETQIKLSHLVKIIVLEEYCKSVLQILRLWKGRDRWTALHVASTVPGCSPSYPNTAEESPRELKLQAPFLLLSLAVDTSWIDPQWSLPADTVHPG